MKPVSTPIPRHPLLGAWPGHPCRRILQNCPPVEAHARILQAEIPGEEGHGGFGFEQAEAHYRAGTQGLRLSEIPQQLRELL